MVDQITDYLVNIFVQIRVELYEKDNKWLFSRHTISAFI